MEEKKVTEVVDFPVRQTNSLGAFCGWHLQDSKEVFDSMPIKEVREACLKQMNADNDVNVGWLFQRVKAYREIGDYETVCMLLRTLCQHQYSQNRRIVDLMIDSIRFGMNDKDHGCAQRNIKEMLVILCGKLQYAKDLYNGKTRKLFQEIIEKFYERSVYSSSEGNFQLISRILYIIINTGDVYFIPILGKLNLNKEDLAHVIKYVSVSKERISFEGLRMVTLKYLKGK